MAVVRVHVVGDYAEVVRTFVAEGGKVGGPGTRDGGPADYVLKEDVSGCYEGHEVA